MRLNFAEGERMRKVEQAAGAGNDAGNANEAGKLFREQVRWLYSQAPVGLFATALNSLVLTVVLWKVVPHWRLIVWLRKGCWHRPRKSRARAVRVATR